MTTAALRATATPTSFPDPELLKAKAASDQPSIVYQPYLDREQHARLAKGAVPFDISFNVGTDAREYELFKTLHQYHKDIGLDKKAFWGLVSSKFELKSPTSFALFLEEADDAFKAGCDCYVYNPMIGNFAIYANVWEQGRVGNPNMDAVINFLDSRGYPVRQPQGLPTFFFCNYMVGNEKFWSGYFEFCEPILAALDEEVRKGTPVGIAYGGSGHYSREPGLGMRPFVIERFVGMYLQKAIQQGLKMAVYRPTRAHFDDKFGKRLADFFYPLFMKKVEALNTSDRSVFDAWHNGRTPVFKSPMLAFHADDPPPWVLSRLG
jgi:hypothetical protein